MFEWAMKPNLELDNTLPRPNIGRRKCLTGSFRETSPQIVPPFELREPNFKPRLVTILL